MTQEPISCLHYFQGGVRNPMHKGSLHCSDRTGDKTKLHFYNKKSSINLLSVVGGHIIVQFFPPQRVSILEQCNAHFFLCFKYE